MNIPPRTSARNGGFTLAELMVSFAVLGLTLTLLLSALWFSVRSWDAAERNRDATHTLALVQAALARQLRQARPIYAYDGTGQRSLAFAGARDRLSYIAPLSRRERGLYLITLYREHRHDGDELRLAFLPWRPGLDLASGHMPEALRDDTVELLTGVRELDIAYFGALDANAAAAWHTQWNHPNSLPEKIRIRIASDETHAHAWPDLTLCPDGGAECLVQRSRQPHARLAMQTGGDHAD